MTLTEIGDALRASPCAWRDIPASYRAVVEASLLPQAEGFVDDQRYWFARWWLACAQEDVDAINAALPTEVRVAPVAVDGSLYLGSDLLTDSMQPGQMYYPAQEIIQGLTCTNFADGLPETP